jgi:DNA-binding HxlR family transcriptional regulator
VILEALKENKDCSRSLLAIRDALELLNGKWKIPILGALIYVKTARFAELQKMLGNITPRMLSKELKELEFNRLVKRKVVSTQPIAIEYEITEHGESCRIILNALETWGNAHRKEIIGDQ